MLSTEWTHSQQRWAWGDKCFPPPGIHKSLCRKWQRYPEKIFPRFALGRSIHLAKKVVGGGWANNLLHPKHPFSCNNHFVWKEVEEEVAQDVRTQEY